MPSFDVISKINYQEFDNALANCLREIGNRYDFKGLHITIERKEKNVTTLAPDDHVRMDLFYGRLSKKGKAKMDVFTSFFLIFYLILLFFGSITSLIYTIETKQKLFTAWAPYVWPIKTLMLLGILLMLLQAFSTLFKDIANMKDKRI